jgi:hypothetical protein
MWSPSCLCSTATKLADSDPLERASQVLDNKQEVEDEPADASATIELMQRQVQQSLLPEGTPANAGTGQKLHRCAERLGKLPLVEDDGADHEGNHSKEDQQRHEQRRCRDADVKTCRLQ